MPIYGNWMVVKRKWSEDEGKHELNVATYLELCLGWVE